VAQYRLEHEYGAQVRLLPVSFYGARWVSGEAAELERLSAAHPNHMARDGAGVLAYLALSKFDLDWTAEKFPKVRLHALREYSGLEEEALA
jgi:peptide chain release factor 3